MTDFASELFDSIGSLMTHTPMIQSSFLTDWDSGFPSAGGGEGVFFQAYSLSPPLLLVRVLFRSCPLLGINLEILFLPLSSFNFCSSEVRAMIYSYSMVGSSQSELSFRIQYLLRASLIGSSVSKSLLSK